MVMYFQDDFWEAVEALPEDQQDAAIAALVRYHFTGQDSNNPIANAILTVSKKRIDLSKKRSKAGATKKQNEIKTKSKSDQTETSPSLSLSNSISNSKTKSKKEYSIKIDDEREEYSFAIQCLKSFNQITGKSFKTIPTDMAKNLCSKNYSIDEIEKMVEYKNSEWKDNSEMKRYIKPDTLFRVSNLDRYIDESQNSEVKNDLSIYDMYD